MRLAPAISALGLVLFSGSSATVASPSGSPGDVSAQRATLTVSGSLSVAEARAALVRALPQLNRLQLQDATVRELRSGRTVFRFPLRYQGVPVLGALATLVVDGRGHAEARSGVPSSLPDSVAADVSFDRAVELASVRAGLSFGAAEVNLAIVPTVDGARLAYVAYRGVVGGVPFAPLVKVDAETGEVISAINTVRFDRRAHVHPENPTSTPETIEVTLPLDDGVTTLTNDRVKALNCIDKGTVSNVFGQVKAHHCDLEQLAVADELNGDFLTHVYDSDTAAEDTYAEVAMFYHLNKVYDVLTGLGMEPLQWSPLNGVVNLRMPQGFDNFDLVKLADGELPLVPFDNAFYAGADPIFSQIFGLQGGALWFGQGNFADFAYDGDVVYHEFGHAVVDSTIGLVGEWHVDSQGAMPSPGSMNEGLADYFSAIVTDDGVVGEYVGGAFGRTAIRTIDNQDTCPAGIGGEVHYDSTFFSGAMWEARKGLTVEQKALFDQAILEALQTAPSGDVSYADVAEQFVASVEATDGLGSEIANVLSQSFTDRGVLPRCERVIDLVEGEAFHGASFGSARGVFVPSKSSIPGSGAYAPGALQFHVELPEGATEVTFKAALPEFSGGGGLGGGFGNAAPFSPGLIAFFGEAPIQFAAGIALNVEAEDLGENTVAIDQLVEVPEGATHAYFMIVNFGETEGMMTNVRADVTVEELPPGGEGGAGGGGGEGGESGEGSGDGVGINDDVPGDPSDPGGCGCRVAAPSSKVPAGAGLLALLAAGLVPWARRRSRAHARA